jgi:hypothetical protein
MMRLIISVRVIVAIGLAVASPIVLVRAKQPNMQEVQAKPPAKNAEKPKPLPVVTKLTTYKLYYQIEATPNPYTLKINGKHIPIEFDKRNSDKITLNSLHALRWNIRDPNSDGNIRMQGKLIMPSRIFVIKHWYIRPPILWWNTKSEIDVDEIIEKKVPTLTSDDFIVTDSFNPKDPAFVPAKFTRPLKSQPNRKK